MSEPASREPHFRLSPAPDAIEDAGDSPIDDPDARDALARQRDQLAEDRDREAALRDCLADAADAQIAESERGAALSGGSSLTRDALIVRAARARERAAADRASATAQRAASARDRSHAACDRRHAGEDRDSAAADRAVAGVDDLTHTMCRGVGLQALGREVARAQRTNERLVIAFVDVDALKRVNDTQGHAAGDRLLARAANLIMAHLRPYDFAVRVGGDEFVCSLSGVGTQAVRERFADVSAELATGPDPGWISVGLAELRADDSLDDVIARADATLLSTRAADAPRRFRRSPRPMSLA